MTAYLTHRDIAFALAVLIGLGAFAGSARELWRIAESASYGLPIGLVAALDGLAVVCVIVLSARKDWQAMATLAAATLLSVGLQVLAVPTGQPIDRYVSAVLVHALVPLASFVAIHLATRLDRPGQTVAAKPKAKPATRPAPVQPPVGLPPTPIRPPKPDAQASRAAARVPLENLVPLAERAAGNLERKGTDLSRRSLQAEMRAAGHPVDDVQADQLVRVFESARRVTDTVLADAVASGRGRLRPELLALAVEVAGELGKAPADLSRRELQDGIKAHPSREGRGIGTKVAGEILEQLRTSTHAIQDQVPDLEVVR